MEDIPHGRLSVFDLEREEECGICLETTSRVVLPNCCHSLCLKCFENWSAFSSFLLLSQKFTPIFLLWILVFYL